jgi:hypothetical protein
LKFLACIVLEKNQYEVFACFFENSNSKSCSESRFHLPFFLVYIDSRLSEQFSESLAGFGSSEQLLKAQAAIRMPEQAF